MQPPSGAVVWFTGLPAAGKTTLARAVRDRLAGFGVSAFVLDGDELRTGLNADLGFSAADRAENVRRTGEVARLFAEAGLHALCALVSPYRGGRDRVRTRVGPGRFLEVYLDAPLEVCEARDPKGLYARARRGDLPGLTGVDAPYEAPEAAELVLRTATVGLVPCVDLVVEALRARGLVPRD